MLSSMNTVVPSYPENMASLQTSVISDSYGLNLSPSVMVPETCGGGGDKIDVPVVAEPSTDTCSLC